MIRGKKGGYLEIISNMLYLFTTILILIGMGLLVSTFLFSEPQEKNYLEVQPTLLRTQLFTQPNCFAFQDSYVGRVDYFVVDEKKLTNTTLASCLNFTGTTKVGVRITDLPTSTAPYHLHLETEYFSETKETEWFTIKIITPTKQEKIVRIALEFST